MRANASYLGVLLGGTESSELLVFSINLNEWHTSSQGKWFFGLLAQWLEQTALSEWLGSPAPIGDPPKTSFPAMQLFTRMRLTMATTGTTKCKYY